MKVTTEATQCLVISKAPALDPIRVYADDVQPGQGRITITCYGLAWTAYWAAMGRETVREFVATSGADYIVGCLATPKMKRADFAYLTRIVEAVQQVFRGEAATKGAAK